MHYFQLFHWLLFSLSISILPTIVTSENSLKVCTKSGLVYEVSSSKCTRGAWTSLPVDVDCVCGSGLWILSESYCDKSFYLLASKNSNQCFKINRPVRRFLSLSKGSGIDGSSKFHFSGNLESFNEFSGDLNVQDPPEVSYVITFNETKKSLYLRHEEGISSKFWQKCFKPSEKPGSLLIVQSSTASLLSSTSNCDDLRETVFGYGKTTGLIWNVELGSMWHPKDGIIKSAESCTATCGNKKPIIDKGGGQKPKTADNSTVKIREDSIEYVASEDDYDLAPEDDSNNENDTDIFTEKMLDNGRDTIRVIHYLKKWIVHNIPGPKVQYKEYKYMQLARIIFLKSCPEADGHTLTNFIRIFRFLIYEAFKKFPDKYPGTTDIRIHNRIVESLRRCFNKVKPYNIDYNEKACPLPDGSQPIKIITDEKGTNYSASIKALESDGLNFKTGTDSDVALEAAWKMMLHAHYQCADEFKEHPEDLSTMYVKLQEFLTSPRIIFRWENPGDYLNKVYGFLHPGFKKDNFAQVVDACVNAAKESSAFEEWLRRPKDKEDYNHNSVVGRSMALFGAKGKDTPTLFDGNGYCVKKFDDPLIWTDFDKSVNAKC